MKENNENKAKAWRKTKRIILLKIQLLKMEKILLVILKSATIIQYTIKVDL